MKLTGFRRGFCLTALVLIIGCSGDSDDVPAPPVLTAIDEMQNLQDRAEQERMREAAERAKAAGAAEPSGVDLPADVPTSGEFDVEFETTVGKFVVHVNRAWAPIGAHRFYQLVKDGFYNDCGFFRVVPGFVVQFGLAADPAVTAKWKREIPDDPVIEGNHKGYVTFATSGPNSRTTQIFINLADNSSSLDPQGFSAFGKVTSGMSVVEKITSQYEGRPDQGSITYEGNKYLKANFPELDYVTKATIVGDDSEPAPADETPAEDAAKAVSADQPADKPAE